MKSEVSRFIEDHIPSFHKRRLESLTKLELNKVLLRKNPYLFKAKNITTGGDFVKRILDAHLSSQEETVFGEFLEDIAIFVCGLAYNGRKSSTEGIDLEFEDQGNRYIVSIKSGPNWGNSSQIKKMKDNFTRAKKVLRQNKLVTDIVAVNGCCYGRDMKPDKGEYSKLCGESFWALVSGEPDLYLKLIEPLGHRAHQRNKEFEVEYVKAVNRFTLLFLKNYCLTDGSIDWEKLVKLNSARTKPN